MIMIVIINDNSSDDNDHSNRFRHIVNQIKSNQIDLLSFLPFSSFYFFFKNHFTFLFFYLFYLFIFPPFFTLPSTNICIRFEGLVLDDNLKFIIRCNFKKNLDFYFVMIAYQISKYV